MRALTKVLMQDVLLELETLRATAALIPDSAVYFPKMKWPSMSGPVFHFALLARAIIESSAAHAPMFIQYGLNPRVFGDARGALSELIDVDQHRCLLECQFSTSQKRLKITVDIAKKRRSQLAIDLRRVMTPVLRADWEHARSLGRSHRPKELPVPSEQKLLPPPEAGG